MTLLYAFSMQHPNRFTFCWETTCIILYPTSPPIMIFTTSLMTHWIFRRKHIKVHLYVLTIWCRHLASFLLEDHEPFLHIDGLVQESRNSFVNALLHLSCTNHRYSISGYKPGHQVPRYFLSSSIVLALHSWGKPPAKNQGGVLARQIRP